MPASLTVLGAVGGHRGQIVHGAAPLHQMLKCCPVHEGASKTMSSGSLFKCICGLKMLRLLGQLNKSRAFVALPTKNVV